MEANLDLIGSFFAFDKDTGKIRHINDVQKGLECNCICPECHNLLIARKGKERTHHFAHASSSSGINELCSLGETIIHILGKEVIREAAVFYLPAQAYRNCNIRGDIYAKNNIYKDIHELRINDNGWGVKEEETDLNSGYIPDITLTNDKNNKENSKIWIEIKRTHGIDEKKTRYIIENEIPTIEVDLSDDYLFEELNGVEDLKKRIRDIIIAKNGNSYVNWFYLPAVYKRIISYKSNDGDVCLYNDIKCYFGCEYCIASDKIGTKKYCIYNPEAIEEDKSKVSDLLRYMADSNNINLFIKNNKNTEEFNTLTIYGLLNTLGIRSSGKTSFKRFLVQNGVNLCLISQDDEYHNYGVIVINNLKMVLKIKNKCTLVIHQLVQDEEEILNILAQKYKCNICMQLAIKMKNNKGTYFTNSEIVSMLQKENNSIIKYFSIGNNEIHSIVEYLNPIIPIKYNKIYGLKWHYHFCPYNKNIKIFISDEYPYSGTTDNNGKINTDNGCPNCTKYVGFNDEYNFCIGSIDC